MSWNNLFEKTQKMKWSLKNNENKKGLLQKKGEKKALHCTSNSLDYISKIYHPVRRHIVNPYGRG